MLYKIIADIVVLIHFLWILFLFLGALLGVRYKSIKIIHLSGLFFAILIQIPNWYCPLTHLEFLLRSRHDPNLTYTGSFIAHYAEQIVYLRLSSSFVLLFTVFLLGFNGWFYFRKNKSSSF